MAKVVGYVVALGLLAAGVLAPAWLLWDDEPAVAAARASVGTQDPTVITDYDATFELQTGGDLVVEEQLTVDFPTYDVRTGITRWFDRVDDSDERVRRTVRDLTATFDGEPVDVELTRVDHGRFDRAVIGDPDVPVESGEHRYVISYRVPDALEPGYGDSPSSLHWDLVPATWQQDIEAAELTVRLPAPALDVQCGIGPDDAPPACDDVTGQGTDTLVVRTGPLPDHTPVRVRFGVAAPRTDAPHLVWKPQYDVVLGQDLLRLGIVLGAALVAGLLGLGLARGARERRPRAARVEEPPAGLGPAQAAYVATGRSDHTHYLASLVLAGQHGAVDIVRRDGGWTVTDRAGAFGWAGLDPVTGAVAHLAGPGASFTIDPTNAASGERLGLELAAFGARADEWARGAGLVATVRRPLLPALLVVAALVATVVAVVWNPFDMTVTALVPGLFAVAALSRLRVGRARRRTASGREVWGQVRGFDQTLAGSSSDEGYDFTGREDRYAAYLPWAVALGRTQQWADAYRADTGHEPPGVPLAAVVVELDAAVADALASRDSTRSASRGRRRRRPRLRSRRRARSAHR